MPTTVDVTVSTVGPPFSVTVNPDPVPIPSGVHGPIQWRITNPPAHGWKFQMHGIDIVNPGTEFVQPTGGGMRVFTWINNHTKTGTYKYAVRVENATDKAEIDPQIINN
jgi:hypothetical protein